MCHLESPFEFFLFFLNLSVFQIGFLLSSKRFLSVSSILKSFTVRKDWGFVNILQNDFDHRSSSWILIGGSELVEYPKEGFQIDSS